MNTDALFKELEPPLGGAERFARKLDEVAATRPSPRRALLAAAAAVAAAAVVTVLLLRQPSPEAPELVAEEPPSVDVYNAPELDRLLGRSSQPTELVVTVNAETVAVTELASANQKVRIYQIN